MKRIGLITTLHRRPELTRVFLEYSRDHFVIAAAYTDDGDLAKVNTVGRIPPFEISLTQAPNQPRSDKWNAAAALLRDADVDGAFVAGSDDFLSPAYVERVLMMADHGADYISPVSCYFYDAPTRRWGLGYFDRVGAGRYLSRSLLEACDFAPWTEGSHRNSDHAMGQKAGKLATRIKMLDVEDHPLLDVKTDVNIWSYDFLRENRMGKEGQLWRDLDPAAFEGWAGEHFPGLYEKLIAL